MNDIRRLESKLQRISGRGYKVYKDIAGKYVFDNGMILDIHHVQGDPFASPSKIRIFIPLKLTGFTSVLFNNRVRRVAFQDYILRVFAKEISRFSKVRGTGKSGLYFVDAGGQEILHRSDCIISEEFVEIRFTLGLPARGRSVLAQTAIDMFCKEVPKAASQIRWENFNRKEAEEFVNTAEDAEYIRQQLPSLGIVAFIADGSILPRRSGVDSRPLEKVIPFKSPESLRVEVETLHHGKLVGMGIPEGITLIVGGGFHGKSTLLSAIQEGVYRHIPSDGREWVVTIHSCVKIRSEDGRYIYGVDISPFINNLPLKADTKFFCTENASGSTSVAAALIEALEMGAKLILIDEDTTATNFLIRDARMQRLVEKEKEPITPFIDRVRELYSKLGISTIMVVGGAGDYLDVADTVIAMESYIPKDVTQKAKRIVEEMPTRRISEPTEPFEAMMKRIISPKTFTVRKSHKVKSRGLKEIQFGTEVIDVSFVEQLVDNSQLRCIAEMLRSLSKKRTLSSMKDEIYEMDRSIREKGFDALTGTPAWGLAYARPFEVASALNRMRTLIVQQEEGK